MTFKRLQTLLGVMMFFWAAVIMQAQSDRATIFGTVTDTTGAVVPDVEVVATQMATGGQIRTVSNGLGFYTLSEMPIGQYELSVTKTGFANYHQTGIVLQTQQKVQVNIVLKVGESTETITVTATPILPMQTQVGTNLGTSQLTNLPLTIVGEQGGRDVVALMQSVTPNQGGGSFTISIAGSQQHATAVNIDGTSADSGIIGDLQETQPSMDALQEVQLNTAGLSAADGRTAAGSINLEMKSGTDKFHGSAFGFIQNEIFNSNTWTNNFCLGTLKCPDDPSNPGNLTAYRQQYKRPYNRYFDYGFSAGGPIWKNWFGLKKMYIFGAYEKYMAKNYTMNPFGGTVPTEKMLSGDFSELLVPAAKANWKSSSNPNGCTTIPCLIPGKTDAIGNPIYYGSIFSRSGLVAPGNVMTDPISPLSQKIVDIYRKYYAPTRAGTTGNFPALVSWQPLQHQDQFSLKYDWWVTDNDHIAASYVYTHRIRDCQVGGCGWTQSLWQPGTTTGGPLTNGQRQITISPQYRINETHTFSPALLNVIAFTYNSFDNNGKALQDIAGTTDYADQVGFGSVQNFKYLPQLYMSGSSNGQSETSIGNAMAGRYVAYNAMLNDALTWNKGRHVLKFGFEYRALGFNQDTPGSALTYDFETTTHAPTDWNVYNFTGSAFANFLLGDANSANKTTPSTLDSRRKEWAFFAEDDVRLTPRLTVHGSLRWELTRPLHVLNGHWTNWDPSASNPVFGGIPGNYTWLAHSNDSFETYTDWHQLAPSLGGSYKITDKMVVRGSAGITFVPLGWNGYSGTPYGQQVGYNDQNTAYAVGNQQPSFQWDDQIFPATYTKAAGPDPANVAYQSVWGPSYVDPKTRMLGFTENWYAAFEYQLPANTLIEVSYLGNSGRNLHDGNLVPYNFPTWSTYQSHLLAAPGHMNDWVYDNGSAQAAGVTMPYPGFAGNAWMAFSPFPQTRSVAWSPVFFTNSPIGQSGYNAFTVQAKKPRGTLNLDLSYNWNRVTGNTGTTFIDVWGNGNYWYQDPYKYREEAKVPQTYQSVKGYVTYTLPLGRGQRFLSGSGRLVNTLVSGWQGTAVVSYGNGSQNWAVGSSNPYPGWSALYTDVKPGASFKNHFKRYDPTWNPTDPGSGDGADSLFVDPSNFSNPAVGQLGNSPRIFPHWRGWAKPSENASVVKKTRFGSDNQYAVTIRADFMNVLNRHYWGNTDNTGAYESNFASPYFGHVDGVSGSRTGQLGARFEW